MGQPNKWEKWQKNAIKMQDRLNELFKIRKAKPKRKLDEPFQDGWIVTLELNQEDLRSRFGAAMVNALNTSVLPYKTRDSKQISKTRKNPKFSVARKYFMHKDWKGNWCYTGPTLASLKSAVWNELHDSVKKYFDRVEKNTVSRWGGQTHTEVRYVLNIPDNDLVVKIKKNIITELPDIDPDVEREMDWLEFQLADYYRHSSHYRSTYDQRYPKYLRKHVKVALKQTVKDQSFDVLADKKVNKRKYE